MARAVDDRWMEALSDFIEGRSGLHFPRDRWLDLAMALGDPARALGFDGAPEYARHLLSGEAREEEITALISRLTVGETYFFREEKSFIALEKVVLPQLIAARRGTTRRLRIWSAGCSTGEEAYSIGIVLSRLIRDLSSWEVTILATDINAQVLEKAQRGIYTSWAFRTTPEATKHAYFRRHGSEEYEIVPEIKKMVTFANLNLVEDVYPSLLNHAYAMDIIFFRNVLMYFTRARARRVLGHLAHTLAPDGWLFPGAAEASYDLFSDFETAEFTDQVIYRRKSEKPARAAVSAAAAASTAPAKRRKDDPRRLTAKLSALALSLSAVLGTQARKLANEGRLDEALAACDKAVHAEKTGAQHHYLRGLILEARNEPDEAVLALRRALFLDPKLVLAHYALGNLMRRRGRRAEAARSFTNVRQLLLTYEPEAMVPESDGLTAQRLLAMLDFSQES